MSVKRLILERKVSYRALLTANKETLEDCRSCLECSRDNGCVRCPERLFLFLQREGMSHHGTCLHACPAGHYGQRGKDINRCESFFPIGKTSFHFNT
ncbi:hypothetical protein INR49_000154 [Caranx melampygus]|nr:hypothetical protein INR49_000154 [Caranx melampygus]